MAVSRPSTPRAAPTRVYRAAVGLCRPFVRMITRPRRWRGAEHLPGPPFLVVANHISVFDPFTMMDFLTDHGIYPAVLAKASLWRYPVVAWVLRQAGAVPVHRQRADARDALTSAEEALGRGHVVLMFPEGTTTLDPCDWPMRAKTGAARLALRSGVPVVPIAQWGAQRVIPNKGRVWCRPFPPTPSDVLAGAPVDLADLRHRSDDPDAWLEATARIMARLTEQLAQIRGEEPPEEVFDRRSAGV